jgi:hypothetical protein
MDEERGTRKLFDALNRAWNAYRAVASYRPDSDWKALKGLFTEGLPPDRATEFASSDELAALAAVEPPILDHSALLSQGILGSNEHIPYQVQRSAAEKHLKFRQAVGHLRARSALTDEDVQRTLVRSASFLYVIRSNLMHGEKFGPDPRRRSRDRIVATFSMRVLERFFDLLFDYPSTRLAVYGSLRPNGHFLLALVGSWSVGFIYGTLSQENGFPVLRWGYGGDEIEILIFHSQDLPRHYKRLDEVEGGYQRILAPVGLREGGILIANMYGRSDAPF